MKYNEFHKQLITTTKESMFLSIINNKVKGQVIGPDNIRDVITTETGHLSSAVRDVIDEKVNRDFRIMKEAVELLKFYKQDPNFSCFDFDLGNMKFLPVGVEKYGNVYTKVEIGKPISKSTELQSMEKQLFDIFKKYNIIIDYNHSNQCSKEITIRYKRPYGNIKYYLDMDPNSLRPHSYPQFANDINSLRFVSAITL